MRSVACILGMLLAAGVAPSAAHAVTIVVPDVSGGAQNLMVGSLGATTAASVGFGSHVVGPGGVANEWLRPICQFPVSSFADLAGLSGDGGAHAVVGTASFGDGLIGAQSLAFSATALAALEAAINGTDPTLVISFREFDVSWGGHSLGCTG